MMFSTGHNVLVVLLVTDTTLRLVFVFLVLEIVIIAKYILHTTQQILQIPQMEQTARIPVLTQALAIIVVIIIHLA